MDEFAIIPTGRPSEREEFKHQPGVGPFGGDPRASGVFGDAPRMRESGTRMVDGAVVNDDKEEGRGHGPNDRAGVENKTIHVFDKIDSTYKDINESDFDPKRHKKDVVEGVVTEAEDGEKEEFTKKKFLDLVADARIPNGEYRKGGEAKTKRDNAVKQLNEEGINVAYIRSNDIPGADQSAIDKRKARNEEIDRLMSSIEKGEVTEADREILLSENINLTQERLDEWGVNVVEEGEKELTDDEKREELIKKNENI